MTNTIDIFIQKKLEIANMDGEGHFSFAEANLEIGHLFTDDNEQPIPGLTAYHRKGSRFVELSHRTDRLVTEIGDLEDVLAFPTAEDLVVYRTYDNDESFADSMLRKIAVGTHLPVFVDHVQMQQQNFSSLELTHQDPRFNVSGKIKEPSKGKKLKDFYYSDDDLRFSWIRAGGHGKSGDAEA